MVTDVNEQTFQAAVIDRSHELPVVVDFWAQWCGPCRALGPVLERAVAQQGGKIELVKLDTDANPALARAFGIQSIPAVKAFRDGKLVSEFLGALPAPEVERFLAALLPSEADELVGRGDEASLRRAVELEPSRPDAAVPLAHILHARGEVDAATAVLERVPGSFAADGLLARIALERAALDAPPGGPDLHEAFAALDDGEAERGLGLLIDALATANGARDEIRRVVVGLLDELGATSDLAREMRRRLATALY